MIHLAAQPEARGGLRVPRFAPSELCAGGMQLARARGAVDGAVDPPAAGQTRVGGVDHCVDVLSGDVPEDGHDLGSGLLRAGPGSLGRAHTANRTLGPARP